MERARRVRWIVWMSVGLALFASAFRVGLFKDRIARHIAPGQTVRWRADYPSRWFATLQGGRTGKVQGWT